MRKPKQTVEDTTNAAEKIRKQQLENVKKCQEEVAAILKKYGCRLDINPSIIILPVR